MSTLRSIVLCGGSGTRLWPLSRALYPKQFMDLGGHTLFGDTVDRAAALPDSAANAASAMAGAVFRPLGSNRIVPDTPFCCKAAAT